MDDQLLQKIAAKIGTAILIVALLDLIFVNWWLIKKEKFITNNQTNTTQDINRELDLKPSPISSVEPSPLSTPSSESKIGSGETKTETKTIVEKQTQTIIQTAQKEMFIPIGSGSGSSATFTDISGLRVRIYTNIYAAIDSVVFEATIWPEGGNGRAYARIINTNDNNPFIESVISNSTETREVKNSQKIPIPSGQKTYGVQAKTDITNFAAHVENARIKITLKEAFNILT